MPVQVDAQIRIPSDHFEAHILIDVAADDVWISFCSKDDDDGHDRPTTVSPGLVCNVIVESAVATIDLSEVADATARAVLASLEQQRRKR
jgi:hypothetical protein